MLNFFDLTGEVAFVTGASKGLGKMFANTLAAAGAKVCLLSFEKEDLIQTEKEMTQAGSILQILRTSRKLKKQSTRVLKNMERLIFW